MATQTRNAFALQLAEKLGLDLTDPVQSLIDAGITTEGADFRGNDLITREEAITMFGRGLGVEGAGGTGGFGDVDADHYASGFISAFSDAGVIQGVSPGEFGMGQDWDSSWFDQVFDGASSIGTGTSTPGAASLDFNIDEALAQDPDYAAMLLGFDFTEEEAAALSTREIEQILSGQEFLQSQIDSNAMSQESWLAEGRSVDELRGGLEAALANIGDQRGVANEMFDFQGQDLDRKSNLNFETRGFWRSSARTDALGRNADRVGAARDSAMLGFDSQANANSQAMLNNTIRRGGADRGLQSAERSGFSLAGRYAAADEAASFRTWERAQEIEREKRARIDAKEDTADRLTRDSMAIAQGVQRF